MTKEEESVSALLVSISLVVTGFAALCKENGIENGEELMARTLEAYIKKGIKMRDDKNGGIQLNTKEHADLMNYFEKLKGPSWTVRDFRRESKEMAVNHNAIYCNGQTNALFLAFRHGYSLAKAEYMNK